MEILSFFQQNELTFYGVRAAVLGLALVAFAFALGRWRRTSQRDMRQLFSELDESRSHSRALFDQAEQLCMQVRALQARFEDREQLVAVSAGGSQRGYDLALQMARNGALPDDIVSASGVTRHEAALLTRLHNPAQR